VSNAITNEPSPQKNIYDQVRELSQSTRSRFLKIQPEQSLTLGFDASKARTIEREFKGKKGFAVEYTVMTAGVQEKILTLSLSWALTVNDILEEKGGRCNIKVSRRGEGTDTRYTFIPL
jgi:hypothetical protein